ncbi:hypothetical protein [Ochrobactrum soli]|uniref:Uncharacterized protein n=1 Tax=Ochrobactrum soli TaxID=2448455 RepID=A0A849KKM3_9HYPH|nr:hypothetical protein [[Ochrobactrum] soli]NNU59089.1 hypothetical protein [[Ochrobactrum] soli]
MLQTPVLSVGRPDELEGMLGLIPEVSSKIAAILIFAGNIEFRLERAIWRLQNHSPAGVRHATDSQPIMKLIDMFEAEQVSLEDDILKQLIVYWCKTARIAFEFRHSIAHGLTSRIETDVLFHRNRSWQGEIRKRPSALLWGDSESLENIRQTFAVLLRVISSVSNEKRPLESLASPERLKALQIVSSTMGEVASGHGPWFEKY